MVLNHLINVIFKPDINTEAYGCHIAFFLFLPKEVIKVKVEEVGNSGSQSLVINKKYEFTSKNRLVLKFYWSLVISEDIQTSFCLVLSQVQFMLY